jgi:catechol 2,3-dioxygenase
LSIPAATRIGSVHVKVADLERALAFYRGVLGFDLVEPCDGRVAFLSADVALKRSAGGSPPPAGSTGLYHFAINYPSRRDLAIALKRLLAADWELDGAADHRTHEAIYLRDPDRNGIELAWDRDPAVWRAPDGRITMTTEPLDFEGLLAEAAGAVSIPSGTRIGHVHLKVADIGRSLAFYQGALGFDLTARMGGSAAFLSAGGYHHHLGMNTWESRGGAPAPRESTGLDHFTIVYPSRADLEAAAKRLGGTRLNDPDGIGIELTHS